MLRFTLVLILLGLATGCSQQGETPQQAAEPTALLKVETPEPLPVPEPMTVSSDTDWEVKVHNKDIEIIQVLNVINPVAAYITAGFDQYGTRFSSTLQEEWNDTVAQLTKATELYDDCKARRAAGQFDKTLFLDMEEVWQLLVKTGVAGVRTKSMVDSELHSFTD